ncbi:hypothetical protein [Streptomyces scabiei]|uniref:hypothetical protein n=1 Tax=Streptomyces scabiei TaxID=1930 RepID=UPI0029BFCC77|nr:hypothetical protein [Streptomyces scabiei]
MRRLRGGAAVAVVQMCAMTVSGCTDRITGSGAGAGSAPGGTGAGATAGGGAALAAAKSLLVKGRAPKARYDREKSGAAWADTDSDACDTRVVSVLRGMIAGFSQFMPRVVRCAY